MWLQFYVSRVYFFSSLETFSKNMNQGRLRVLLRWGLAILLSAAPLFFLFAGFSIDQCLIDVKEGMLNQPCITKLNSALSYLLTAHLKLCDSR